MDWLQPASAFVRHHTLFFLIPAIALLFAYYALLPRPLPGIPCDPKSARSIWGDLLKVMRHAKANHQFLDFFAEQCAVLNSPVVQLLISHFSWRDRTPAIVVSDMREIEDICSRRTKQFDRIDATEDSKNLVLREATLFMGSHDRFKAQRKLWAGTMTPEFLHRVASNYIRSASLSLVDLWRCKANLAQQRPFEASGDLRFEAFDAIWAFSVGNEVKSTKAQLQHLNETKEADIVIPPTISSPVAFPKGEPPDMYTIIMNLLTAFDDLSSSAFPDLKLWYVTHTPWFRAQLRAKEKYMDGLIAEARATFEDKQAVNVDETIATSAMDQVLRRLHNSKISNFTGNSKEPDRHLKDELFLFLLAGYETTSTTLAWAVKFLAAHQDVQSHLRASLHAVFFHNKSPSTPEILAANIPYLDAFIAENFRCSMITGGVARQAKCDTSILGHPIPKGAAVIMCTNASTYLHNRDIPVAEEKRSQTSQEYGGVRGQTYSLPVDGRREFKPERWLQAKEGSKDIGDASGNVVYNEHAGLILPFGLGPRGCFGRRLAMMKLKITMTLMVLNLEFLKVEGKGKDAKGKEFDLDGWTAREKVARTPDQAYVRLRAL